MMIAVHEPDGERVRRVEPLKREDAPAVWEKLKQVQNFTGSRGISALLDPKIEVLTIDDVGVAALDDRNEFYARVHITFWDRRMRGRTYLCRRIAQYWMDKYSLDYVYTSIPRTSKHSVVIAFAKRVGFEAFHEDEQNVHLILYNLYLHGANSPTHGA